MRQRRDCVSARCADGITSCYVYCRAACRSGSSQSGTPPCRDMARTNMWHDVKSGSSSSGSYGPMLPLQVRAIKSIWLVIYESLLPQQTSSR